VFGDTRPLPPGIIEVGGCTYKKPMPLPEVSTYLIVIYLLHKLTTNIGVIMKVDMGIYSPPAPYDLMVKGCVGGHTPPTRTIV